MLLHLLHHLAHIVGLFDLFLLPVDSLGFSQICMDTLKKELFAMLKNNAITQNYIHYNGTVSS